MILFHSNSDALQILDPKCSFKKGKERTCSLTFPFPSPMRFTHVARRGKVLKQLRFEQINNNHMKPFSLSLTHTYTSHILKQQPSHKSLRVLLIPQTQTPSPNASNQLTLRNPLALPSIVPAHMAKDAFRTNIVIQPALIGLGHKLDSIPSLGVRQRLGLVVCDMRLFLRLRLRRRRH